MNVDYLIGKVVSDIVKTERQLIFTLENGEKYQLHHIQDCCEYVMIEDIIGDLKDLIGTPITMAEESTSHTNPSNVKVDIDYQDSFTWTFYRFATVKGYVTVRWYGESNGYYSETVDFEKIEL